MTEEEFLRRWDRHIEFAAENLAELRKLSARADEHIAQGNEHIAQGNEHIAQGNEHMARGNDHMARGNVLWAENREALVELRQSIEDMRVELRQTSLRGQRVAEKFDETVRTIELAHADDGGRNRAILDDLLEENRAGRNALFVILDEIRGRGGPAAAGA
jgi:hypothetical protein